MDEDDKSWMTFPNTDEAKLAFNLRSEASVRAYLRSRTWEEKVASIVRMRAAGKIAREGMRKAMAEEKARVYQLDSGVSSETCDVKPLA